MTSADIEELIEQLRSHLMNKDIESAMSLLEELHAADQADIVEDLKTENQVLVLENLSTYFAADVLEELEDMVAAKIAESLEPEKLAVILDEMEYDEAADVLGDLPPELTQIALEKMEQSEEVAPLLKYPDDTAGGLMTTDFISLRGEWTVGRTLDELRKEGPGSDSLYYLFVTDETSKLIGVVALRNLVSAQPETKIKDIMERNIISVDVMMDQEECALTLSKYGFLALPVIDQSGTFLGVITADDLIEVTEREASEDILRLAGIVASGEETVFGPARVSIVKRLPWLAINIITLFIAVSVIDLFEEVIAGLVILAVFLPIVSGEGGNAGSQSVTVIVRGLAVGELTENDMRKALGKEILVSIINGAIIGLGTAIIAFLWKGNLIISIAIFLAMVMTFLMAAFTGVVIPLSLKKANIDPALASTAFVTGFTDTFGFLFFLGITSLLL